MRIGWIVSLALLGAFALVASGVVVGGLTARQEPPRAQERAARPGLLVRLGDGRRINLRCSGHGSPTILLEGGFAATSEAWYKVQPAVSRTTRVCSYDRAGYGLSDPGPFPRDGASVARDLDGALRAAGMGAPFVLVGHSAGALYVRLFADRRPSDVVGMVLVEPSVEPLDRRLALIAGPGAVSLAPLRARAERCLAAAQRRSLPSTDPALASCSPGGAPSAVRPDNWRTQISELDTLWTTTSDEVAAGRKSYGAMPLIVLTAAGSYTDEPEPERRWIEILWSKLHHELAARSTKGSVRLVEHSSHMLMLDRPDAVCEAIWEVIARVAASERRDPPDGDDGKADHSPHHQRDAAAQEQGRQRGPTPAVVACATAPG